MVTRAAACVILLAAVLGGGSVAHAQQERPATPQLIEAAVERGDIARSRGHQLAAYAIGRPDRLPAAYRSTTPWDATLLLLELRRVVRSMPRGERREDMESALAATGTCDNSTAPLPNTRSTSHFIVDYGTIGGGLTIDSYVGSLETSWSKQIAEFGWAAPPFTGGRTKYFVRIADLADGLYGFVSTAGFGAGFAGDNPNTSWNDADAYASCMVLNSNFDPFPGTPQAALNATTAHEFNHALQFGYGAIGGPNVPDDVFFEGGATWMEDEVFDDANDSYNYLWPVLSDSMGDYDSSPYQYWIAFRGLTERFGTGVAGGGEDVMQRFWELTGKNAGNNVGALEQAIAAEGITLDAAFHDYAIAARFNRPCGGGLLLPHCFEEALGYPSNAAAVAPVGTIASIGGSVGPRTVENDLAIAYVALPTTGDYAVALTNNAQAGGSGRLRGTVVCNDAASIRREPLTGLVADGEVRSAVVSGSSCPSATLVVTNETRTSANPTNSGTRSFSVATSASTAFHVLSVSRAGEGTGTVTSDLAGIQCGADCTQSYLSGAVVTLTASPAVGSAFSGWSGACSGTATCQVTMTEARAVTAEFAPAPVTDPAPDPDPDPGSEEPAPTQAPVTTNPIVPVDPPLRPVADTTAPYVSIAPARLRADRRGYVRVRIACPASETAGCLGRLSLHLGGRIAAPGKTFRIAAGQSARVRVRLNAATRKRLAKTRRLRVRASAAVADAAGNRSVARRTLTVRR